MISDVERARSRLNLTNTEQWGNIMVSSLRAKYWNSAYVQCASVISRIHQSMTSSPFNPTTTPLV